MCVISFMNDFLFIFFVGFGFLIMPCPVCLTAHAGQGLSGYMLYRVQSSFATDIVKQLVFEDKPYVAILVGRYEFLLYTAVDC